MASPTATTSTISTGGGGDAFQQQVCAAFLGSVLTGCYLPVVPNSTAITIHLQAKRLGWNTDDVVIECRDKNSKTRFIAAQIKRTFTISKADAECCATLQAAWADFNNAAVFDQAKDALALIVHLGPNRLLGDFGWLLAQARASSSTDDFDKRLDGGGLLNKSSKKDYATIQAILKTGTSVTDQQIWSFLRAFYLLSYDFTQDGSQNQSNMESLLEYRAINHERASSDIWNELVTLVSNAAFKGKSFSFADLPDKLKTVYQPIAGTEHAALAKLQGHSKTILARVDDAGFEGFAFPRAELSEEIAEAASNLQVVLIVGSAGGGKSMLAKRLVHHLAEHEFVMVLGAEELNAAHIDSVLTNAQVGMNFSSLQSILTLQPHKTILIEGLERLLESEQRGALKDLLKAASADRSLRLVLTCRDYHADTVEGTMIAASGLFYRRVVVPDLTDSELKSAVDRFPALAVPMSSPALHRLLKNPFLLMRAASVSWTTNATLPLTERALRQRLWGEVVRRDDLPAERMPARRAEMLTKIALDRALVLRPYVPVTSTDHAAVEALALDGIIVFDSSARLRAAPAHDVFEDWALVEWLSEEFARVEHDAVAFVGDRQTHPALRRAYRKWLQELIETDAAAGSAIVSNIVGYVLLPAYLRDDTFVAVFQSSFVSGFIDNFGTALLANDALFLKQAMHVVRVSSKRVSYWARGSAELAQVAYVPTGAAWANLLDFALAHWPQLPASIYPLTLGFLEDWAHGVSAHDPNPSGASSAGKLLSLLLPTFEDDWDDRAEKRRVIELLLKIPKPAESLFLELTRRSLAQARRRDDRDAALFFDTLLKPFQSYAVAREFPDELISLCLHAWFVEPSARDRDYYSGLRDVESVFGLGHDTHMGFFPPSAHQGPFLFLMRTHAAKGGQFILDLLNRAVENYGQERTPLQYVEGPQAIPFLRPNGTEDNVWANERLWQAYRGTSVASYLLECALMAFEGWLLEVASVEQHASIVEDWLVWIANHANNAALLGLVASVCIAHPTCVGTAGLALLRCRAFFDLDLRRQVSESHAMAIGGMGSEKEHFQKERLKSNKLEHRSRCLEDLARQLQCGSLRDEVWKIMDAHRAALPSPEKQDDSDRLWRLALDRMDYRCYAAPEVTEGKFVLQMKPPAADIQDVIDRYQTKHEPFNKAMSLFFWANNVFERRASAEVEQEWRARLVDAQNQHDSSFSRDSNETVLGGPAIVAAICVRDHWDELVASEQAWSETVASQALEVLPPGDTAQAEMSLNTMDGIAAIAHVIPKLRSKLGPAWDASFFKAILHFNRQARHEAIRGLAQQFSTDDHSLGMFGAHALFAYRDARNEIEKAHRKANRDFYEPIPDWHSRAYQQSVACASDQWRNSWPDFSTLPFVDWQDSQLIRSLLALFQPHASLGAARDFFTRLADLLTQAWQRERRENSDSRRDYELEAEALGALAGFALDCSAEDAIRVARPIINATDSSPDKVADFVRHLTMSEDVRQTDSPFWEIWDAIAQASIKARWVEYLGHRHSSGQELIRTLMLNSHWKKGLRVWAKLGQHHTRVDELFSKLPASADVLGGYAHFLFHVGGDSLPEAFIRIAEKHGSALAAAIPQERNLLWYLNCLVSREMYEHLPNLRQSPQMRAAFLSVLDALVEAGSSLAFQMRDDFVTPSALPSH